MRHLKTCWPGTLIGKVVVLGVVVGIVVAIFIAIPITTGTHRIVVSFLPVVVPVVFLLEVSRYLLSKELGRPGWGLEGNHPRSHQELEGDSIQSARPLVCHVCRALHTDPLWDQLASHPTHGAPHSAVGYSGAAFVPEDSIQKGCCPSER